MAAHYPHTEDDLGIYRTYAGDDGESHIENWTYRSTLN